MPTTARCHACFSCVCNETSSGLSCVPPPEYHSRFEERVISEVIEQVEHIDRPVSDKAVRAVRP